MELWEKWCWLVGEIVMMAVCLIGLSKAAAVADTVLWILLLAGYGLLAVVRGTSIVNHQSRQDDVGEDDHGELDEAA